MNAKKEGHMSVNGTNVENSLYRLFENRIDEQNGVSTWTFSRVSHDILTVEVEMKSETKTFHITLNPNLMSDLEHAMMELDHYFIRVRNNN